jgi:hypothetical protein
VCEPGSYQEIGFFIFCYVGCTAHCAHRYQHWTLGPTLTIKVNMWINLRWGVESMDWIDLALDRGRWRALVNAVMNLRMLYPGRVPKENVSQILFPGEGEARTLVKTWL